MTHFFKVLFAFLFLAGLPAAGQQGRVYTNPILAGFYPDPSICQAGKDYYLVNSSFAYYPGLPLFHSRDLVNWTQIGHAMDRPEQLDLTGAGVSRGLFAPSISYHKGVFYIVCTLIDKGGNFVITANDPKGPWSNPVWLKEVDGIDPSLFFDDNGKAFILYNSVAPGNQPQWDGHRTIRMRSFDPQKMTVSATETLLVNGGVDVSKKPVWIEGPHIYQINGWYYLMCAEGGTAYQHSEVIFRSRSVEGPYVPFEQNPILTQRHLDPNRKNPVTTTGHADLVQAPDRSWHAVFLGCRPYTGEHFNTGRETFMAPVTWKDGWPVILKGDEQVQYFYPAPGKAVKQKTANPFSGNFIFRDEFKDSKLNPRYTFLRTVKEPWYRFDTRKGLLHLTTRQETISGVDNPSFVGHRQQHLRCTATTSLSFQAAGLNEKAGLVIFQNEGHYYFLSLSKKEAVPVVQLWQSSESGQTLLAEVGVGKAENTGLRIEADHQYYHFSYSTDGTSWKPLKRNVDATFLSTQTAGGFVGAVFGLYTTSEGKSSSTVAAFDWFEYRGDDPVYRTKGSR